MKIAIASGKGGTGKTTVAVNVLKALSTLDDWPLDIVDCDVEEPNVFLFLEGEKISTHPAGISVPEINKDACSFCGQCARVCNYHALVFVKQKPDLIFNAELCHGCGACTLFCGPRAITEKFQPMGEVNIFQINEKIRLIEGRLNTGEAMPTPVLRKTKSLSSNKSANRFRHEQKHIVYDAPPGTSCTMIETVEDSDYALLVTEPTPFGLHDVKLAWEAVKKLNKPAGLVINRADLGDAGVKEFAAQENIEILLEIPFDQKIAELYAQGKVIFDELEMYRSLFIQLANRIREIVARNEMEKIGPKETSVGVFA